MFGRYPPQAFESILLVNEFLRAARFNMTTISLENCATARGEGLESEALKRKRKLVLIELCFAVVFELCEKYTLTLKAILRSY